MDTHALFLAPYPKPPSSVLGYFSKQPLLFPTLNIQYYWRITKGKSSNGLYPTISAHDLSLVLYITVHLLIDSIFT